MYRRSLVVLAALAALVVAVPTALAAARVHVRVEGKTQTIFGATEPTLTVKVNVLDAIEAASLAGEFYYHVRTTGFGPYVDQIGRYAESIPDGTGWVFKVNGILPPVGAAAVELHDGDTVVFYYAKFTGPAGPLTLEVENSIVRGKRCFFATGRNDAGHASRVRGVVFTLNGRRISSSNGVVCTRKASYAIRVAKNGAIRSRLYIGP